MYACSNVENKSILLGICSFCPPGCICRDKPTYYSYKIEISNSDSEEVKANKLENCNFPGEIFKIV